MLAVSARANNRESDSPDPFENRYLDVHQVGSVMKVTNNFGERPSGDH